MMPDYRSLSSLFDHGRPHDMAVALLEDGQTITRQIFINHIAALAADINDHSPSKPVILACEDAYFFLTGFCAALVKGRGIVIPPNIQPLTISQIAAETSGDVLSDERVQRTILNEAPHEFSPPALPRLKTTQITLYTSGSTGQHKAVVKPLAALEAEIDMFNNYWGQSVANGVFASSVTHYHAYGLPFYLLWAVCRGNMILNEHINYPEILEKYRHLEHINFVSSPAFLNQFVKILDKTRKFENLRFITSAGSPLPLDTASILAEHLSIPVTEIYGSTETGAMAQRNQLQDPYWQRLKGVEFENDNGHWMMRSPYTGQSGWQPLSDNIEYIDETRFILKGRQDRIVKIFEKRVSLTHMEQVCKQSPWISEAKIIMLAGAKRPSSVVILTDLGLKNLKSQGKQALLSHIREYLRSTFDLVVLPRRWRFVDQFPTNELGKIQEDALMGLFTSKSAHED